MSIDYHRHCQATVLSANGTGTKNGATWDILEGLTLNNLSDGWLEYFMSNTSNITQDFASVLKVINNEMNRVTTAEQNIVNLRSYVTDSLSSFVSSIKLNGSTYTPSSGLVDLGSITSGTTIVEGGTGTIDQSTSSNASGEFDPTKFHTVFFDPGQATSIEFTTKSLYEGSKYGKLPTYTLNGESKTDWYLNGTKITSTDTFNSTDDITLTTTQA